jgi:hypothetical protein
MAYGDGNHLSPRAKIVAINGKAVDAWFYRGGHQNLPVLELISEHKLATLLDVGDGGAITATVIEVEEGEVGMPGPPPPTPGKRLA